MPALIMGEPSEKQKLFLTDTHKYIAFGGARGGGKSWAARFKAILLSYQYPGIKCMIVRKTYPELQENHINPLISLLRCYHPDQKEKLASYNEAKKHIVFPNGSRILFRYCDNEKDAQRFQGTECDVLFLDEATHHDEIIFDKLKACVRGANSFPKRIYITCNPGGPGHQWVKRLFVDREYKPSENPDDYVFIRSLVTDNYALMQANPDYVHQLEALPSKLRKAWLDGDWNIFEGQYFEEFTINPSIDKCVELGKDAETLRERHQWCHVIKPFESIPQGWTIYRAFDWGYAKPFAMSYYAIDYDGTAYNIAEFYGFTGEANEGVKWDADRVFREIRAYEDNHPLLKGREILGVADPAIWDVSRGMSIAEQAMQHGIIFTPGDNKRISGWMQVHYRLAFDNNGRSRLYICQNCKQMIRTMPLAQYDETHCEDLDTDGEEHLLDSLRYFCMARPIAPLKVEPERIRYIDPLESNYTRR